MSHITSCKVIGHIGDQINEHTAHINLGYCKAQSLTTNLAPKRRADSVATSLAFTGRRIGRADDPDHATPVFLQKNLKF
jgi:hypothetical protein